MVHMFELVCCDCVWQCVYVRMSLCMSVFWYGCGCGYGYGYVYLFLSHTCICKLFIFVLSC